MKGNCVFRFQTFWLAPMCLLTGCNRAPTFDIAGSLFPAWMICLVLGICLSAISHWFLLRRNIPIVLPVLVFPCLAMLFTFLLWLIFFS
jgi:fructose-specific phosphotransferase system IIC component